MKKLPFLFPPIIDAYSGTAGIVAIQMCDKTYESLIIYNHFVVTYYRENRVAGFNWKYYNDKYVKTVDLRELITKQGVIPTFIHTIENNMYIHVFMDHYYIRQSQRYKKKHFLHDCATIFGYENDCFFVADNFFNGKFSIGRVPFSEVELAVTNNKNNIVEGINLDKNIDFRLEKIDLMNIILSYLKEINIWENTVKNIIDRETVYGIGLYDILNDDCNKLLESNFEFNDYRTFHVMYNHMKVGVLLVEYINENLARKAELIKNEYEVMCDNMLIIRNLFIKSILSEKKENILRIKELLFDLREQEKNFLEEMLKFLEKLPNRKNE